MFNESEASIGTAMHRLKKAGKILELKRGIYAFANPWRKAALAAKLESLNFEALQADVKPFLERGADIAVLNELALRTALLL